MHRIVLLILTLTAAHSSLWGQRPGDDLYIPDPETVRRNSIRTLKVYELHEDSSEVNRPDSLCRVYRFDSLGRVVEEVNNEIETTHRYAYDEKGRLARAEWIPHGESSPHDIFVKSYDDAGNPLMSRRLEYDAREGYRTIYTLVEDKLIEETSYIWDTLQNQPISELIRMTYRYNSAGRLIECQSKGDFGVDGLNTYTYDSVGRCTDEIMYDDRMAFVLRIEHVFESDLVLQRRAYWTEDILKNQFVYRRNEEGLIIEEERFEYNYEGELVRESVRRFDYGTSSQL